MLLLLLLQVMRSYREAQQVADALGELGVLLKFACMWDPKAYKARQHTVAGLRKDALLIRWAAAHSANNLAACSEHCFTRPKSPTAGLKHNALGPTASMCMHLRPLALTGRSMESLAAAPENLKHHVV